MSDNTPRDNLAAVLKHSLDTEMHYDGDDYHRLADAVLSSPWLSTHDAELAERVRVELESLITDLDLARADGTVFTYGAVQERLAAAIRPLSTTPERSNT